MTSKKTAAATKSSDLPEPIADFVDVQERLQQLQRANPKVFKELRSLIPEYNEKQALAHAYVRQTGVSAGPFVISSTTKKYDAESLFEIVGKEKFLELGGSIGSAVTYSLDKTTFELKVAQKAVTKSITDKVTKEQHTIKRPDEIAGL